MVVKRAERQAPVDAPRRRLFTIDEYYRMSDAGILGVEERTELLEGEIISMAAIGTRHAACVSRLDDLFHVRLQSRAMVRVQNPVRLPPNSEPQPDLLLVRYREDHYNDAHPVPADVFLVIEVSDSSLAYDRDRKLPRYAADGIPEVWIADLAGGRVLAHRGLRRGRYTDAIVVARGGSLAPAAFPDIVILVDEILGPPE